MNRTLLIAGVVALLGIANAQAAGDVEAGKAKAAVCAGCHGPNGPNGSLAGESEAKFLKAMNDYKSGKLDNAVMKAFASKLSDQDTANLAAYYASLSAQ